MNVLLFNKKIYKKQNKLYKVDYMVILYNQLMDKYQEFISHRLYVKKWKNINVKILVQINQLNSLINCIKMIN